MCLEYKEDHKIQTQISDIEDLIQFGEYNTVCPYYLSRELEKEADLVFMPYNYLVDPTIRKSLNMDLKNSIVLLDEGHNVVRMKVGKGVKIKESVSNDASSFEITTKDLKGCIAELEKCIKYITKSNYSGECTTENLEKLKGICVFK